MTTVPDTFRSVPRRPLAVLGMAVLFAIASQVAAPRALPVVPARPVAADTNAADPAAADPLVPAAAAAAADLDRIRENITFWSERTKAAPRDFISASRWAESEIELARATGDISAYIVADEALDVALAVEPGYAPAIGYRGVVLIALHRFADAVAHASAVLAIDPDDTVALATLGDGSLELGDVATARSAYEHLATIETSAAALVRLSHLAFIDGKRDAALESSRAAVAAVRDEGAIGSSLAWYQFQLGELSSATGDLTAARGSYDAALAADPSSHLARWGLARLAAAEGDLEGAIAHLDAAIERIPLPEFLARRSDLFELRGGRGDADRASDDRATVLAIAQLYGGAAGVYDRTLSLFLASHDQDPARALRLAETEIAVRRDVYGYDALAWALLANGRATEAQAAMEKALASGVRDAKLLYHAGAISIALGDDEAGRVLLRDALALDPSFDPRDVARIRQILSTP